MSKMLLEKEQVILDRKEITTKGYDILKTIKEKLPEVIVNEDVIAAYKTDISEADYFIAADISMNGNSYILYIDQVIDERAKVIIVNTNSHEIVMFDIDDIESIIKYINHGDKNKLYRAKLEKEYNPSDFSFTKYAHIVEEHEKYFESLKEYLNKNSIIKTPEERNAALAKMQEMKNVDIINPMTWGEPIPVGDIIKNASSVLAQSTIHKDVIMDTRQVSETINPMELIPGPDDNTELEDMDEESKRIYEKHMYKPSSLILDPKNPDMSDPVIRKAMNDRKKKAEEEILEYKKNIENISKKSPLSNKRM